MMAISHLLPASRMQAPRTNREDCGAVDGSNSLVFCFADSGEEVLPRLLDLPEVLVPGDSDGLFEDKRSSSCSIMDGSCPRSPGLRILQPKKQRHTRAPNICISIKAYINARHLGARLSVLNSQGAGVTGRQSLLGKVRGNKKSRLSRLGNDRIKL